jgi:hypothetical protein
MANAERNLTSDDQSRKLALDMSLDQLIKSQSRSEEWLMKK